MSAITLHASGQETTSGTGTTQSIAGANEIIGIFTNITAVSGTLPTLTLKLQHSPDGNLWVDVPNGSVGYSILGLNFYSIGTNVKAADNIRLVWTVGGLNAHFTFEVQIESI